MGSLTSHPVRPRRRRRRWLVVLGLVVAIPLLALLVLDWRLWSSIDRVDGAFDGLSDRPAAAEDGSVTVLLIGTSPDVPGGGKVAWAPGAPDVDSVMVATIAGDRRHARIDWLPLTDEVRAGVTGGSPSTAVSTVEDWTGRRVDHLAALDMSVVEALAVDHGTTLDYDPGAGIRHEQRFMQEVLELTLEAEMRKEPWTLYGALHTIAGGTAIDAEWSLLDLHLLAVSLRDMRSAQIEYATIAEPAAAGQPLLDASARGHQYWR